MAHKTRMNGTNYEISGGKTLVNGTAYSIDKGKTLVGGTAYDIGFGPAMVTITITGYSGEGYGSVSIDGTTYWSATTIEVPIGTVVECYVNSDDVVYLPSRVIVNGVIMANTLSVYQPILYSYTVSCNITININETYEYNSQAKGYRCDITITEQ